METCLIITNLCKTFYLIWIGLTEGSAQRNGEVYLWKKKKNCKYDGAE